MCVCVCVYIYIYIYIYIDEAFCISHSANTIRKCMNPATLPPTIGKY